MSGHAIATAILLSLGAIGTAGPVAAQLRPPAPSAAFARFRSAPSIRPRARPASFIHSTAPDYRWEGLVIGAVALGGLVAFFVNGMCNDPDSGSHGSCVFPTLEGALFGATAGGVTGGLLGGLIPKSHPDSSR